jgi:hypothetical protein
MSSRIFFAAIAGFWLVMNFLLWRSQEGAHSQIGSAIPAQIVWNKILTAPDNSSLEIYDHGKKTGFCQWTASVGGATQALNQSLSEDYAPDGLIPQPSSYVLSLEGNTMAFGTNRVRFEMRLHLSTNQTWQDFYFTAKVRSAALDVHAIAASGKITVKMDNSGESWQRTLKFSDLQHPEPLLAEFGIGGLPLPLPLDSITQSAAAFHWDAHEDWMPFGHSKVRVYRLETVFFGQRLSFFISRAGEILSVDAPDNVTLRNTAFSRF